MIDFARGTRTRFTFGQGTSSSHAIWSPDGTRLVFRSYRDATINLYQKPANGAKSEEILLKSRDNPTPTSWSRDGRFVLYAAVDPKTKSDLWVLPMDGDRKPMSFLRSEFNEDQGRFSPDGRWVAYVSDESGRSEVYVHEFSPNAAGGKWLVSKEGGTNPRWRGDGKMLFYSAADGTVMAVDVTVGAAFQTGAVKALFKVPPSQGAAAWDVTADGQRFLVATPAAQSSPTRLTVVLNWQEGLKK